MLKNKFIFHSGSIDGVLPWRRADKSEIRGPAIETRHPHLAVKINERRNRDKES